MDDWDVRARVPADVEAPDKIVWGLTARQLAILAGAAALGWLLLKAVGDRLPAPAIMAALFPLAGVAVAFALGRRDGQPLDAWVLAAVRHIRRPRRMVPAPDGIPATPVWAPPTAACRPAPAVLRLPAHAIRGDGVIDLGDSDGAAVLVAATTVNVGLRTGAEQAALVSSYAGWLNALTGPVQVAVSSRRVDLGSHAYRVAAAAGLLPHPALADAALDYADFLHDLAADRDPLWRTVTIACTGRGAPTTAAAGARRSAEHTAAALATLGALTRVLDGATATAVLTAAVDPYQFTDASWPRTPGHDPVTAAHLFEERTP